MISTELQLQVAPLGYFYSTLHGLGIVIEAPDHLLRRLYKKLVGGHLQAIFVLHGLAGLNTEKDIVRLGVVPFTIVAVVGRDYREREISAELDEHAIDLLLLRDLVVLDFEIVTVIKDGGITLSRGLCLLDLTGG